MPDQASHTQLRRQMAESSTADVTQSYSVSTDDCDYSGLDRRLARVRTSQRDVQPVTKPVAQPT